MRIHLKHLVFILLIGFALSACKKKTTTPTDSCSEITDTRDGQKYKVVKIGDQCWMAENLNYETATNSFCYGDDPANCDEHGKMYTWGAANSSCPNGWRLPTKAEFDKLIDELGGVNIAGGKLKEGGSSGFNAKLSGFRDSQKNGKYSLKGVAVTFWTSTPDNNLSNVYKALSLIKSSEEAFKDIALNADAVSCRCIKD
jgi:uncharacterized protein (TIGR02145 family)